MSEFRAGGTGFPVPPGGQSGVQAGAPRSSGELLEILNVLPTAVYVCDAGGLIEIFNPSAAELWGRAPLCGDQSDRFCGSYRLYRSDGVFMPHAECPMARALHTGQAEVNQEITVERPDGSRRTAMVNIAPRRDAAGRLTGAINCMTDITALKSAEERIRHLAHFDALTGLANRTLLQDRLQQAIAHANRQGSQVAVLFLDLDNFKHINDSRGHELGDHLLQAVAVRLRECLREGDSVARLGGDEFVLTTPILHGNKDAALVAQKLLAALNQPIVIQGVLLQTGASIGISLYPNDGLDVESLMRAADTAMYHAKESGRGNYQFFTAALNRAAHLRHNIELDLRQALARNEFQVYFQPQVAIGSGRIIAAEALLRWQRPNRAPISCGEFIVVAEQSGLIVPIGEWALQQACAEVRKMQQLGAPDLCVAVNLSARQFFQPDLLAVIKRTLEDSGLPPTSLTLEITESILMERSRENIATLKKLSALGISLSIDDFGTGYSSLAYLQRFPINALKIDRSFVRGVEADGSDTTLVRAIIAMARSLRLNVLAEGVESVQQAEALLAYDCFEAQGYFYSKAVPAEVFARMLAPGFAPLRPATLN